MTNKTTEDRVSTKRTGNYVFKHKMYGTRFYKIWENMKQRCDNPNVGFYHKYGGRGITYIERCKDFTAFMADMYESYLEHAEENTEIDTTLDRIDNNQDYNKENCRWATRKVQANNRNIGNKYKGEHTQEASRRLGGHDKLVNNRLSRGWDIAEAFTAPVGAKRTKNQALQHSADLIRASKIDV